METKITNHSGIMETECTSGAGAEHNVECFHNTGLQFGKVFMPPNKTQKHNLWPRANEVNIVPNLHSTLISIPKMANANYVTVFDKDKASVYNTTTTTLTASKDPLLAAPCCHSTGLWKFILDFQLNAGDYPDQIIVDVDKENAIFNLPNNRQMLLYLHAVAGFPPEETFLSAARAGNYAMRPSLTTTLISKYFPNLEETQKGHMKDQQKGIRSTKVRATARIKIEPGTAEDSAPIIIKCHYGIFLTVMNLTDTIHTNQTGAFLLTLQQGYQYIMVGIHLDSNYIFFKLMKNKTEGKMITVYQKMVDRMNLSAPGLKHHR
jgi:hypothetical protein